MLYLRTASGSFINAATIARLSPDHAGDHANHELDCDLSRRLPLAPYFTLPGRIEPVLAQLPTVDAQAVGAAQ